ncbi:MAG: hypothetical protein IJ570_02560 [Prevotella sp.]|nr:hypothetical protein [Prevotella sp.]
MILNTQIIDLIKSKSGLVFDKAKDYDALCDHMYSSTGRTIGVNTVKRLMGYIVDDRKTNEYTLNTIGIYLGFKSWEELCNSIRIDSDWNFDDETIYVDDLALESKVIVKYLNRTVTFKVIDRMNEKMLLVEDAQNSSLKKGDILEVEHLRKGDCLEAKKVYRDNNVGNYRTNGELKEIIVNGF